jgi:hypothetical protein
MENEKLSAELADLHGELGRVVAAHQQLDPRMIDSLKQVAEDIARVLNAQPGGAVEQPASPESDPVTTTVASAPDQLPQTLEELAEQFSVDHPQTAALLSRLGYLLANLGI